MLDFQAIMRASRKWTAIREYPDCELRHLMIVFKSTQDKVLAALQSVSGIVERQHNLPILASGGASAALIHAPVGASVEVADGDAGAAGEGGEAPPAASDDDDGGDDDGDPDRRRSPHPSSLRGKHRNATATAGALLTPPKDIALWRLPTVLAHVPISRSGWWAGVKAGRYPAPVRISTRCVAWKSEDIRALINSL